MFSFTLDEYFEYSRLFKFPSRLEEKGEEYVAVSYGEKVKKKKEDKKVHQYYDKLYKSLLDDKKEFVYFMKRFFGYDLKEKNVEKYTRTFVIKDTFKKRESDIIYKIKNEEIFIIVEHQSTIDYMMPIRMTKYCINVIESRIVRITKLIAPIVFPIVLSTASKPWDVPLKIEQIKDEIYGFKEGTYPEYNVVDVHNYTTEELLNDRMGVSLAMVFEKEKTIDGIRKILKFVLERGINEQEEKCLWLILEYSNKIRKLLGEKLDYYKNKLRKEGTNMENFEKAFLEILNEEFNKGMTKGIDQGINQGISKGVSQVVMKMLKNKMKDEDIIKNTDISKQELEKLKLQVS